MKVLIKKCPKDRYLQQGTFSVSQREFDLIQNRPKEVVVELYTGDNRLFKSISGRAINKLVATPRTAYSEDSLPEQFYVVDFSEVK